MNWSAALNVAIGLTLVYLVFSVAASRINEFVAGLLQWRAKGLERALYTMLGGPPPPFVSAGQPLDGGPVDPPSAPWGRPELSAQAVKNHPTVAALESAAGKARRMSYLPSRAFSAAVLDLLAPPAVIMLDAVPGKDVPKAAEQALGDLRTHPDAAHLERFTQALPSDSPLRSGVLPRVEAAISGEGLEQLHTAVVALPADHPARRPLLRMVLDAGTSRDAFRSQLEHWYDDEMSRVTGWYKRSVQRWIIAYGVALTLAFNVDTLTIAETLWRSPVEQAAVAQAAANTAGSSLDDVDTSVAAINGLAVPVGWTPPHAGTRISSDPRHVPLDGGTWLLKALGWMITALALTFGAPFWFDVLGKLARVRSTGGVTATTDDGKRP